jgi:murein DD-endopeptidase MepM/ murein hydrolase activator NlpD
MGRILATAASIGAIGAVATLGAGAVPAAAASPSGGTPYPNAQPESSYQPLRPSPAASPSPSGGTAYEPSLRSVGARERDRRKRRDRPVIASFQVSRTSLFAYGRPATISYRVEDRSPYVRVRLALVQSDGGAVYRFNLGRRRTGVTHTFRWRGTDGRELAPEGLYHFRLSVRDRDGNTLVRNSANVGGAPIDFRSHRFPVAGAYTLGGPGARFGAPRSGHTHQGQDIAAAEGTPVVAPRGGLVTWRAYQASGAGYYLVIAGEGEQYNYVFMHLQRGSLLVGRGDQVRTGQEIARVGNTGSSEGAHLHFEIWDGPWFSGGKAIDPLPFLKGWEGQ